jgi:Mobilization protein NikA
MNDFRANSRPFRAAEERKDKVVHARFSTSEMAAIERAAQNAGLGLSAFMRSLTLEGAGVRPFFTDDDRVILMLLLTGLRSAGVNLNQFARSVNSAEPNRLAGVPDAIGDLQKVVAALMLELRAFAERGSRFRTGAK